MGTSADEFYLFSANDLLSALDGSVDLDSNRIVGFYGEVGAGMQLGLGGSGIYFRGVDTQTGELIEAYYVGATLGAGATPGTVGAGTFGFTGGPGSLTGWSVGAQGSAVITGGISIATDGSVLHFYGLNTSLSVNATGGYTYSVSIGGNSIYYFGDEVQVPEFSDSSLVLDVLNSLPGAGHPDYRTVNFITSIDGTDYRLKQSVIKIGDALEVRTYIIDLNGDIVVNDTARALLAGYGSIYGDAFSDDIWARRFYASDDAPAAGNTVADFYNEITECFLAATPILRSDGTVSPIELIIPGDLVQSYDASGRLVPGRVTRTFRNEVSHILDVHGLKVTPGHATLCGDGLFKGCHVPIIDILLSDGALVRADGTLMRMAINAPVGSVADAFVKVAYALTPEDVQTNNLTEGTMRVGTLLFDRDGAPVLVLDCLQAEGYAFDADTGLVAKPGEAPHPLFWFGKLPRPEDYILTRSQETLEGILTDGEWEGSRSELIDGRLRQARTMRVN
jgi:hypothetical protein